MINNSFYKIFQESITVKEKFCNSDQIESLKSIGDAAVQSIMNGGKLIFCGNGGSAADAQHLAAEMLVRLRPKNNRASIPAIALAQDTSTITACGNDFGYEFLYERLISSLGKREDIFIGISTSGNSKNIILAMKKARKLGIKVCGFLGSSGGKAIELCDYVIVVPSDNTGRIQETHITAGHALMEYIEDQLIELNYLHLQ